jgi:putative DNA primase/helicase
MGNIRRPRLKHNPPEIATADNENDQYERAKNAMNKVRMAKGWAPRARKVNADDDAFTNYRGDPLPEAFQQNLLTLLASSDAHCHDVVRAIPVQLYSTKIARLIAKRAYEYIREYHRAPRDHLPDLLEQELKDKVEGPLIRLYLVNIGSLRDEGGFNEAFVVNQLRNFTRHALLKKTLYDAVEASQANELARAEQALAEYQTFLKGSGSLESGVELIYASSITPKAIDWMWYPYIAAGKFHVLGGKPDAGKTNILLSWAATKSSGGRWPDGTRAEQGYVLFWSGEDDADDTLIPRLMANGANLKFIKIVGSTRDSKGKERAFDPAHDMDQLEQAAKRLPNVRMLIVDPIVMAVAGDSHKNAETRRSLQPLMALTASLGCATFGNTHVTKGTKGQDPLERLTGSLAFGAVPRIVYVAARVNDIRDPMLEGAIACVKNNIGPKGRGYYFALERHKYGEGVEGTGVKWGIEFDRPAFDLFADSEDTTDQTPRKLLSELLANGSRPATEIFAEAAEQGFTEKQMRTAAKRLHVDHDKQGLRGPWIWRLPSHDDKAGDPRVRLRINPKHRQG